MPMTRFSRKALNSGGQTGNVWKMRGVKAVVFRVIIARCIKRVNLQYLAGKCCGGPASLQASHPTFVQLAHTDS